MIAPPPFGARLPDVLAQLMARIDRLVDGRVPDEPWWRPAPDARPPIPEQDDLINALGRVGGHLWMTGIELSSPVESLMNAVVRILDPGGGLGRRLDELSEAVADRLTAAGVEDLQAAELGEQTAHGLVVARLMIGGLARDGGGRDAGTGIDETAAPQFEVAGRVLAQVDRLLEEVCGDLRSVLQQFALPPGPPRGTPV